MKDKRKNQPNPFNQRLLYLIIGMAIVIAVFIAGIIFGSDNKNQATATPPIKAIQTDTPEREPATVTDAPIEVESTINTETPMSADSNTVDLPELQTQWAEFDVTKTAVNEIRITETPQ